MLFLFTLVSNFWRRLTLSQIKILCININHIILRDLKIKIKENPGKHLHITLMTVSKQMVFATKTTMCHRWTKHCISYSVNKSQKLSNKEYKGIKLDTIQTVVDFDLF